MPNASDDFVHRIGRTGRAGAKGVATTFVMPQERSDARKLERELKMKFDWREADKNLEKEERNKPVDTNTAGLNDLMSMETRSWKSAPIRGAARAPAPTATRAAQAIAPRIARVPAVPAGGRGFRGQPRTAAPDPAARSSSRGPAGRSSGPRGNSGARPTRGNRGR